MVVVIWEEWTMLKIFGWGLEERKGGMEVSFTRGIGYLSWVGLTILVWLCIYGCVKFWVSLVGAFMILVLHISWGGTQLELITKT